jgi:hypothetical protein
LQRRAHLGERDDTSPDEVPVGMQLKAAYEKVMARKHASAAE